MLLRRLKLADLSNILGGPWSPPAEKILLRPEVQLIDAIRSAGLEPPEHIEMDGKIHRFKSGAKGSPGHGDKPGWYLIFGDGIPAGRFGCWTCTVVRKDKSAQSLIDNGHSDLAPFLEFRNWLATVRNEPSLRWPMRRSGVVGPGPFTLAARGQILERLTALEQKSGEQVLRLGERQAISDLWELDQQFEIQAGIQSKKRRLVPT